MSSTPTRLRLFIIEAPSPMDLLQSRAEAPALEKACSLIGHEVSSFVAKSKAELYAICQFISMIDSDQDKFGRERVPMCVHIAAHGNAGGLGFGSDTVTWDEMAELLQPLCEMPNYDGDIVLVVSACGAAQQKLTSRFRERARNEASFRPPIYLFITAEDEPTFEGALVSWIVFYYHLPRIPLSNRRKVKDILKQVRAAGAVALQYYRWDKQEEQYRRYAPAS
jgi:hypothetical protein